MLKITRICVDYHLKAPAEKRQDAEEALANYLPYCPGAQRVIGCIQIDHQLRFEAAWPRDVKRGYPLSNSMGEKRSDLAVKIAVVRSILFSSYASARMNRWMAGYR